MVFAQLHTNRGESFLLLHPNGEQGGRSLFVFLRNLEVFLDDPAYWETYPVGQEVIDWFSRLERKAERSLKTSLRPLVGWYYYADHTSEEYLLLSQIVAERADSEKYKSMYEAIDKLWADIQVLITTTKELIALLSGSEMPETSFYLPVDTLLDLEALLETLMLARRRGAKSVIIHFF